MQTGSEFFILEVPREEIVKGELQRVLTIIINIYAIKKKKLTQAE